MATDDEQARAGWVQKQLEAELHRVGGQRLLDHARAEARHHPDLSPAAGHPTNPDHAGTDFSAKHALADDERRDDHLYRRLAILTRHLDRATRDTTHADTILSATPHTDLDHTDTATAHQPPTDPANTCGLDPTPVVPGIDPNLPSIARVYDFALGGKNHYKADRKAGYQIAAALPEACDLARDCREFVRRAVTWLITHTSIDQIIDIGSGLPTAGNVHEIAHHHHRPGVRVLYVDNDPVVLAHARALLAHDPATAVLEGDLRRPEEILTHPDTRRLIDTDRPYAVLVCSVLHHLPDHDDPAGLLEVIKAQLPGGSYLAVANFVAAPDQPRAADIEHGFLTSGLGTGRFRPPADHQRYLTGLDLVAPGLVYANDWHPDQHTRRDSPVHRLQLAGVARKP